jgi:hypothetical protein
MSDKPFYLGFVLCGASLLVLCFSAILIGSGHTDLLIKEGGIIETLSALSYFLIAGYLIHKGGLAFVRSRGYFVLLVLLFGMRELDMDKQFTTMGIFKSRLYLNPDMPLWEKALGGFVILILLWVAYKLVRNHGASFLRGLRNGSAESIGAGIALGLVVVSKTLDGLPRKLESIGFASGQALTYQFAVLEEVLEFGIPVFILLAADIHFRKARFACEQLQTA